MLFRSVVAFDQAVLGQRLKNFRQEFERDVIFFRDFFGVDHATGREIAELHRGDVLESHEGVVGFF